MKLLFVHAHFDDFEFTAAGTFLKWAGDRGQAIHRRVLVCTDGAAGHHLMTRNETAGRRWREQERAAGQGGFEARRLLDRSGNAFREGGLGNSADFRGALWKAIRDFEPDYLFCPPIPVSPLAGVHADHLDVAEAVRAIAYFINVPHAYSPEYPEEAGSGRFIRTPVIVNTFDGYMAGGHGHDLAIGVESVVDEVADLAWCHESQLKEWLPWVDRHNLGAPLDANSWRAQFRSLLRRRAKALGVEDPGLFEFFTITAWGSVPALEQILKEFPAVSVTASRLERLGERLSGWRAGAGD